MLQKITHSAQETEQLGEAFAHCLKGGEVIAFSGGMGMGKTAFTRGLAVAWVLPVRYPVRLLHWCMNMPGKSHCAISICIG